MWITLIICASIVAIVTVCVSGERYSIYKLKKMEEESKTAKLALTYQMLAARPELSLEEIQRYIDSTEKGRNYIEKKSDQQEM